MLLRVALVRTDVSEELSASFIRMTRIDERDTTLAVTNNRVFLRSVSRLLVTASVVPSSPSLVTLMVEALSFSETPVLTRATRSNIPEEVILHWRFSFWRVALFSDVPAPYDGQRPRSISPHWQTPKSDTLSSKWESCSVNMSKKKPVALVDFSFHHTASAADTGTKHSYRLQFLFQRQSLHMDSQQTSVRCVPPCWHKLTKLDSDDCEYTAISN
jgi:hypothetical protein